MRRLFRTQRDEDYSQIQYLTAKCTRLAHDKAILDRDVLLSRERERKLHHDLEAASCQFVHQEQLMLELRMKQQQLVTTVNQQQELVSSLQQRVVLLLEESSRDAELLRQVGSELLCLQSSEVRLEVLVEELHAEAQHRAAVSESLREELRAETQHRTELTQSLQTELHSKTVELQQLQDINRKLTEELKTLRQTHHDEVRELRQENDRSLRKLQETAEQFEWLCQQQRYWMSCVKRFKDCLMEERDTLLQQVNDLEKKLDASSGEESLCCPLQDSSVTSWHTATDLESQVDISDSYEDFFHQAESPINGHQKPP